MIKFLVVTQPLVFQVELYKAPTLKKEATQSLKMPAFLEKEAKGTDYIVLWLDCDKEGENICFEVLDAVQYAMNRSRQNEQVCYDVHGGNCYACYGSLLTTSM